MTLSKWFLRATRNCANWQALKTDNVLQNTAFFNSSLSKIVDNALANSEFAKTPTLVNRIRKMAEYHTTERVPLQGQMTMLTYETLEKPERINDQLLHQAVVLACVVELIQSYFVFMDDIEDGTATRHGKPCWHLRPEVTVLASNDFSMLRSLIHEILQQNFDGPLYPKLLNLFNQAYIHIAVGQHLDVILSKSKDYSLFTQENYDKVVRYKCTYYTMEFPLMVAMLLCDRADQEAYARLEDLCRDVGALFQIKNDFMDCFDVESESGKTGTDLQEGKCTWLAVQTLKRCSAEQRKIFTTCYGSWDPENVKRIKELYKDLKLTDLYKETQNLRYELFMKKVQDLPSDSMPPREMFFKLLQMVQSGL